MAELPIDKDKVPDQTLNPLERESLLEGEEAQAKGKKTLENDKDDSWEEYFLSQEDFPPEWVDG